MASRQAAEQDGSGAGASAALLKAWPDLPEAAALHIQSLQAQVRESHAMIRALVDVCLTERDAKEAALREAEDARRPS